MTDRLALTGIEVFARHGVYEEEQATGQTFIVDLDLTLDLGRSGDSDALAETIDYGDLARRVHDLVATERWDLIEKVAESVSALVLEDERVEEVTVTVHKPQAPIPVPFRDVSVTITRRR